MVRQAQRTAAKAGDAASPGTEPAAATRRRKATASKSAAATDAKVAQELGAELEKLKVGLDAAMMRFAERVGGELERVREQLISGTPPGRKVLERVKVRLEEVRLKPQKGRVKDFARLEDLAEDLADLVPPTPMR